MLENSHILAAVCTDGCCEIRRCNPLYCQCF